MYKAKQTIMDIKKIITNLQLFMKLFDKLAVDHCSRLIERLLRLK